MYLLRGHQCPAIQPGVLKDFPVNAIQATESFLFLVSHFQTGHSKGKTVRDPREDIKRRELFSPKLTRLHFPETVRVVRLVSTGVRFPA